MEGQSRTGAAGGEMRGSIPSELSKSWRARRESLLIPSPAEKPQLSFEQQRAFNTKQCTNEGVRAGLKAAAVAGVASAIPTLIGVRVIPWAKANLNYTAQALIISSAAIAAYFIVADKTILECARRNTQANFDKLKFRVSERISLPPRKDPKALLFLLPPVSWAVSASARVAVHRSDKMSRPTTLRCRSIALLRFELETCYQQAQPDQLRYSP